MEPICATEFQEFLLLVKLQIVLAVLKWIDAVMFTSVIPIQPGICCLLQFISVMVSVSKISTFLVSSFYILVRDACCRFNGYHQRTVRLAAQYDDLEPAVLCFIFESTQFGFCPNRSVNAPFCNRAQMSGQTTSSQIGLSWNTGLNTGRCPRCRADLASIMMLDDITRINFLEWLAQTLLYHCIYIDDEIKHDILRGHRSGVGALQLMDNVMFSKTKKCEEVLGLESSVIIGFGAGHGYTNGAPTLNLRTLEVWNLYK